MKRQTIIIIIAAICIWYFIYRTPKDVVETKNTNSSVNNTLTNATIDDTLTNAPVNNTSIYAPIDNTLTNAPINNTSLYAPIYDTFEDYTPDSGIFTKIPVYKYSNIPMSLNDVITAKGHSIVVPNPWGNDTCSRAHLFDFVIPLNIKSLKMECKVRTSHPDKSAIIIRNKTTNKIQRINTDNYPLSSVWNLHVKTTKTDLLNSGYLNEDVAPRPGHEIEIYAQACDDNGQIYVKGATLIYELNI